MSWTVEQIFGMAPDASSAKAGKGLASPGPWQGLGAGDGVIWGLCKGSGSEPYKTRVSLAEPAFKCTCPSRKFPCKHSLGLMLLHADKPAAFAAAAPPDWVAEWLASRGERAAKKAEKAEAAQAASPDPKAQAKRAAQREGNINDGVELLERWLGDLARQGLAHAQTQPTSFWEGIAARMVDAQAPGLARRLREMAGVPHSGEGWAGRLLHCVASLHLLTHAWRRLTELDEPLREDVRAAVGLTRSREEVLAAPGVEDVWRVVARRVDQEPEGLRSQRLWLAGETTGRMALILSFAHRTAPSFDVSLPWGARVRGEVAYYPSAWPQRALLKRAEKVDDPPAAAPAAGGVAALLDDYAAALAANPWVESVPALLDGVTPALVQGKWLLVEVSGASDARALPMRIGEATAWRALALCGGAPARVFGEWDGEAFEPMSIEIDGVGVDLC